MRQPIKTDSFLPQVDHISFSMMGKQIKQFQMFLFEQKKANFYKFNLMIIFLIENYLFIEERSIISIIFRKIYMHRRSNFQNKSAKTPNNQDKNKLKLCIQGRYLVTQIKYTTGIYNIHEGIDLQTRDFIYVLSTSYHQRKKQEYQIKSKDKEFQLKSILCEQLDKSVTYVNECRYDIVTYRKDGILLNDVLEHMKQLNIFIYYTIIKMLVQLLSRTSAMKLKVKYLDINNLVIRRVKSQQNKSLQANHLQNQIPLQDKKQRLQLVFLAHDVLEEQYKFKLRQKQSNSIVNGMKKNLSSSSSPKNLKIKEINNSSQPSMLLNLLQNIRKMYKLKNLGAEKPQTLYLLYQFFQYIRNLQQKRKEKTKKKKNLAICSDYQSKFTKIAIFMKDLFKPLTLQIAECQKLMIKSIQQIQIIQRKYSDNMVKDVMSSNSSIFQYSTQYFRSIQNQDDEENIQQEQYKKIPYAQSSCNQQLSKQLEQINQRQEILLEEHIEKHILIVKMARRTIEFGQMK